MKFERLIPPTWFRNFDSEIDMVIKDCIDKKRRLHVLIEPEPKARTTGDYSQNHHLNGHIQQIAKITGQPFEDIKKYVKQQAITLGYPMKTIAGNPVTDMWGQVVGISEKDATTEQCALLIESVHKLADDLDITLEEGNERFSY